MRLLILTRTYLENFFRYYVCHYGPVGNYIGQKIYKPGAPCGSCPFGTSCSFEYPGLCETNFSNGTQTGGESKRYRENGISTLDNEIYSSRRSDLTKGRQQTLTNIPSGRSDVRSGTLRRFNSDVRTSAKASERRRNQRRIQTQQTNFCSNIFCRIANLFA